MEESPARLVFWENPVVVTPEPIDGAFQVYTVLGGTFMGLATKGDPLQVTKDCEAILILTLAEGLTLTTTGNALPIQPALVGTMVKLADAGLVLLLTKVGANINWLLSAFRPEPVKVPAGVTCGLDHE